MACIFCSIIAGEAPSYKVYEDDRVFAFLNITPVSKGHTLIVPKVHAPNLAAGSLEAAQDLMTVLYNIAPGVMQAVGAQGYNLGMNHGACAGQEVPHTHIQLMPRWEGEPRTFIRTHTTPEELAEIAEKIRAILG